jgi:hypothetical protein
MSSSTVFCLRTNRTKGLSESRKRKTEVPA